MGSSKMAINSLLQDSPVASRVPSSPQPQQTQNRNPQAAPAQPRTFPPVPFAGPANSSSASPKKPTRSKRKDAPLLVQRAVTTPQQPTFNRKITPTLPVNAVAQAQRTQPSPPLSSSGSTLTSTRTISSTLSTPSGDYRPALGGRIMTTNSLPQHRNPTEKMDFLADLASMQHPQQGQPSRNLRTSIDLPRSPSLSSVSRRGSAMPQSNDHPMSDAPTATLQPRTFTSSSLSKSELQMVADLTKQISENTFLYDSHQKLIKLLHEGLIAHISLPQTPDTFQNARDYTLLSDLRQAREAMDSRFPVGEELWLEWIQDECMLAETIDDRVAVMELCAKAVRDEVGSTKIWRLYGDWMWHLYRSVNDVTSTYESSLSEPESAVGRILANQYWTEDEKVVGREVFSWLPMIGVWEEGIKSTEWHIHASHAVWDPYVELLLHDLSVNFSAEKVKRVGTLFNSRLRQPHATWDDTFQRFSQFVSKYDNANYEKIMVSTNEDASEAKQQYGLRQEFELKLQRASQSGDKDTEWTVMTEYLEWEAVQAKKAKKFQFGLDLFVGLSQRSNLRFPTDASLWEDHVDFLAEHPVPRYSLLQLAHNATRHCPWSGNLWSKRLIALEVAGNTFDEIEDVKHHATSSGLLEEVGGMDEVIKVYTSWCGFLRRRAFAEDAAEDDIDVAEVGIKSELENVKSIGEKKYGKDFKGDTQFRVERIWVKFLSQAGRNDEARSYWLQLSTSYGDRWEFWDRFYVWEMTVWAKNYTTAGKVNPPENATAALQRAIRQPNLDWPERMIEAYLHHCAQHESVQKLQEAQVEATRATKQTVKRRAREAAEVAAAQYQQQQEDSAQAIPSMEESSISGKRKRGDEVVVQDEAHPKRTRSDEDIGDRRPSNAASVSESSQLKRDREHTTIIVKNLPGDTSETRVRQFFRDCGKILSLQLVSDDSSSTMIATIEFESKEDVLAAETKSKKSFHGTSIEIQVGTGTTIYVTNYPPEADEEYIRELFKPYGEIVEIRFPSLKYNTHRRFCYVQFLSSRDAEAATQLDGKALGSGLTLSVAISDVTAKEKRKGALEEGREIFVGNLHWKATDREIAALFDTYGTVESVRIPRTYEGKSKGAAFVVFATKEESAAALEMHLKEFMGRVLKVTPAISNAKGPKRTSKTVINSASPEANSISRDSPDVDMANSDIAGSPPANTEAATSDITGKDIHQRTLILHNIPDTVNGARIRALAEPYGHLRQVKLIPGKKEAIVEYVDVRDVGKAEMALAGKEIVKGVLIQVGPKGEAERNADAGAAIVDVAKGKKMTLPFAPVMAKRPGLAGGPRRGGKGGLGFKRAVAASDADDKVDGRGGSVDAADGDEKMKEDDGAGAVESGEDKANGDGNGVGVSVGQDAAKTKGRKTQDDFRAMLAGK